MIYIEYNSATGIPTGTVYEGDYDTVMLSVAQKNDVFAGYINPEYDRIDIATKTVIYASQNVIDTYNNKPANMFAIWDKVAQVWVDIRNEETKRAEAVAKAAQQRQQLLTESDWTQIPNGPLSTEQQAAWATYRQELRDITAQSGYPFDIVWPTAPTT